MMGVRINITHSEKIGLWLIDTDYKTLKSGDFIWFKPTENILQMGLSRNYFQKEMPMLKQIKGLPGDKYGFDNKGVLILNGRKDTHVIRQKFDSRGHHMPVIPPGTVPEKHFFVINSHRLSFDSRYFGPIPRDNVIGTARPLLAWQP